MNYPAFESLSDGHVSLHEGFTMTDFDEWRPAWPA